MGCAAKQHTKQEQLAESLPVYAREVSSILENNKRKRSSLRKLSSHIMNETDYWGTVPFYVLNNRVRLLAFEVSDMGIFNEICGSISDILDLFISKSQDTELSHVEVQTKQYKWIEKYENTEKVIRALGLKIEKKVIEAMEGVTKTNLEKKVKELKYAISTLNDGNFINKNDS